MKQDSSAPAWSKMFILCFSIILEIGLAKSFFFPFYRTLNELEHFERVHLFEHLNFGFKQMDIEHQTQNSITKSTKLFI